MRAWTGTTIAVLLICTQIDAQILDADSNGQPAKAAIPANFVGKIKEEGSVGQIQQGQSIFLLKSLKALGVRAHAAKILERTLIDLNHVNKTTEKSKLHNSYSDPIRRLTNQQLQLLLRRFAEKEKTIQNDLSREEMVAELQDIIKAQSQIIIPRLLSNANVLKGVEAEDGMEKRTTMSESEAPETTTVPVVEDKVLVDNEDAVVDDELEEESLIEDLKQELEILRPQDTEGPADKSPESSVQTDVGEDKSTTTAATNHALPTTSAKGPTTKISVRRLGNGKEAVDSATDNLSVKTDDAHTPVAEPVAQVELLQTDGSTSEGENKTEPLEQVGNGPETTTEVNVGGSVFNETTEDNVKIDEAATTVKEDIATTQETTDVEANTSVDTSESATTERPGLSDVSEASESTTNPTETPKPENTPHVDVPALANPLRIEEELVSARRAVNSEAVVTTAQVKAPGFSMVIKRRKTLPAENVVSLDEGNSFTVHDNDIEKAMKSPTIGGRSPVVAALSEDLQKVKSKYESIRAEFLERLQQVGRNIDALSGEVRRKQEARGGLANEVEKGQWRQAARAHSSRTWTSKEGSSLGLDGLAALQAGDLYAQPPRGIETELRLGQNPLQYVPNHVAQKTTTLKTGDLAESNATSEAAQNANETSGGGVAQIQVVPSTTEDSVEIKLVEDAAQPDTSTKSAEVQDTLPDNDESKNPKYEIADSVPVKGLIPLVQSPEEKPKADVAIVENENEPKEQNASDKNNEQKQNTENSEQPAETTKADDGTEAEKNGSHQTSKNDTIDEEKVVANVENKVLKSEGEESDAQSTEAPKPLEQTDAVSDDKSVGEKGEAGVTVDKAAAVAAEEDSKVAAAEVVEQQGTQTSEDSNDENDEDVTEDKSEEQVGGQEAQSEEPGPIDENKDNQPQAGPQGKTGSQLERYSHLMQQYLSRHAHRHQTPSTGRGVAGYSEPNHAVKRIFTQDMTSKDVPGRSADEVREAGDAPTRPLVDSDDPSTYQAKPAAQTAAQPVPPKEEDASDEESRASSHEAPGGQSMVDALKTFENELVSDAWIHEADRRKQSEDMNTAALLAQLQREHKEKHASDKTWHHHAEPAKHHDHNEPFNSTDDIPAHCASIACTFEKGDFCNWESSVDTVAPGSRNYHVMRRMHRHKREADYTVRGWHNWQGRYRNRVTGIARADVFHPRNRHFAAAYVRPRQVATLSAALEADRGRTIEFHAWEAARDVQLRVCCDQRCVFHTEAGVRRGSRRWRIHSARCPAGTRTVRFECVNHGQFQGACGVDNVRLVAPECPEVAPSRYLVQGGSEDSVSSAVPLR